MDRVCKTCEVLQPLESFKLHGVYRLRTCKVCMGAQQAAYRAAPEQKARQKEYHRQYEVKNKERLNVHRRQYRAPRKEAIREYDRQYRAKNREKHNARTAAYRLTTGYLARCSTQEYKEKRALYRRAHREKHKERLEAYEAHYRARTVEQRVAYSVIYRAAHIDDIRVKARAYNQTAAAKAGGSARQKRTVLALPDSYVIGLLRDSTSLTSKDIPQSLVEVKRLQLQILRMIKNE